MRAKAIIVGLTITLFGSASYALDPLGPPKALLKQGQWSVGLEYAYSQTDTELNDGSFSNNTPIPDRSSQLRANEAYVNLRYGPVHGVLDVFGRLGVVAFEGPELQDGDADIAFGLGAAATLWKTGEKLDWGVLVQFGRGESSSHGLFSPTEIEAWSLQVAGGPTYRVRDDMKLYGGLFLDFLWGEFDAPSYEWDIEEDDPLGVFVGLDWTVKENTDWTVEFQYAGSTLAVATGLRWTFD